MKHALLLLLVPAMAAAALPQQDFIGSRATNFDQVSYDFRLTKTALLKAPVWNPNVPSPPLSPQKAQEIAAAQLKHLVPEVYQWMRVSTITLEVLDGPYWIYLVTFDYVPPTAYSGPARLFTIPVYLDGSIIIPHIGKRKNKS